MSRTVQNANLQSRSARMRLRLGKTHWASLRPGALHLGYVRADKDKPGIWTVRRYIGSVDTVEPGPRNGKTPYRVKRLPGCVDDFEDADGVNVLSFAQAQDLALQPPRAAAPRGPLTVAGACAAYVRYLRHEQRTRAARDAVERFQKHVRGIRTARVADLTSEQLRGWLADLARRLQRDRADDDATRRSRASANRIFNSLRAALNLAYAEQKVPTDAAWRRRVRPFRDVERPRQRFLSIADCQRLINAAQPEEFRSLVLAALHTGARYGELTRLRVHDFNPDAATVHVGRSKSGRARDVHLSDEGAAFFRQIAAGRAGGALLLPHMEGRAWRRSDQQRLMQRAVRRARIDPPTSFHGLRHTWASHAVMNAVPLMLVAKNLGHADVRMVTRVYGHMAPTFERDAIRAGAPRFNVEPDDRVRALRK